MEQQKNLEFTSINKAMMVLFDKAAHKDPESNFAMCPISLTMAFGLLTEGLKGASRQECLETFGFHKDDVLPKNFLD